MATTVKEFTIGGLSKQTGVNIETIRYYEKIGVMPDPPRTAGGYRVYGDAHVSRLSFVRRCRQLGFSIEDLKDLLNLVDRNAVSCAQVEKLAKDHLQSIRQKISDLNRMEKVLGETVSACSGKDVPDCPLIDTLFGVRR